MISPSQDPLEPLFSRARQAPESPLLEAAPPGFASRVLARYREAESRDWTLWLLPRAIGVAAIGTAAMLAFHASTSEVTEESDLGSLVMNLALGDRP